MSKKRPYIRIVEAALGHELPAKAVVHHVDVNPKNDRNDNLAVLQDTAEHAALHRRLRVLKAGGNPWTQHICCHCRVVKDLVCFPPSKKSWTGRHTECKACVSEHTMARYNRQHSRPDNWRESPEERSERNRQMANRRWGNTSATV